MPLFTILTLFPEALEPYLACGVLGNARQRGLVDIRLVDFRDWSRNRHRTVDDRPYGGGPGMLLKPEPIVECVEWVEENFGPHEKFALCPSGRPFEQSVASEIGALERCLLLCGRYEGFDQRIFEVLDFQLLSIGDFVLAGGELPALCVLEAAARLLPGVLGNERSALEDSFDHRDPDGDARALDHPHYTRPRVFRSNPVPDVLLGGDHGAIKRWRATRARELTLERQTNRGSAPTVLRDSTGPAAETERKNA
ncbi:MAG: tRNA (guanine37-N1)-methyltransferase [Chlamydiales bacterium]